MRGSTKLDRVEVSVPEFLRSCLEWGTSDHASWTRRSLFLWEGEP